MSCPVTFDKDFENNFKMALMQLRSSGVLNPLTQCDTDQEQSPLKKSRVGGKSRSGGKKYKMKGGAIYSKSVIKAAIYVILAAAAAASARSGTAGSILNGLKMIYSGECFHVANRVFGLIGSELPVCRMYNKVIADVMQIIYKLDFEAFSSMVGKIVILTTIPLQVSQYIDALAQNIENRYKLRISEIGNSAVASFLEQPPVTSDEERNAAAALASLSAAPTRGGKSKRKNKVSKKTRKSKKSRKTLSKRKTRRH